MFHPRNGVKTSLFDPGQREKINLNFYFYSSLKGFIKVLTAFRKPFAAPQRRVTIKA